MSSALLPIGLTCVRMLVETSMSDFFQQLITEYTHSRPNAKQGNPKRVAKRLGVRKRDFEEFLHAWQTVFGARGGIARRSSARKDDDSEVERAKSKVGPGRLSG